MLTYDQVILMPPDIRGIYDKSKHTYISFDEFKKLKEYLRTKN